MSKEWKLETTTTKGDVVSYMQTNKPEGKIMKITVSETNLPAQAYFYIYI